MPISHAYDSATGWVEVRISGSPREEELLAGADRLLSDPQLPESPRILSDNRELEIVVSNSLVEGIVELLRRFSSTLEGSRIALVAASKANYGMLRMFSFRADSVPIRIEVFSERQEAESWLKADAGENIDSLPV